MSEQAEEISAQVYPGKVGVQQRILPTYRVPFFDSLARSCAGGLQVFVGEPMHNEGITTSAHLDNAQVILTRNRHFFTPSSPAYLCWQHGLIRWLKAWDPDIVVMEANPRYLNTYRALRYVHQQNKPIIGWGLGAPELAGISGKILNWERRKFIKAFDALIAYSHKGAKEYIELGFPSEKVFVASNSVTPRPSGFLHQKPIVINKPPIVLFVGRLLHRKRVDLLIQACTELHEELKPQLLIVGDGPAREELEKLARDIYPLTRFLGSIHGTDLVPIFTSSDLFVLPGTGGLAVQEAMANGLPVIVARGDGTQEDLVRPENGWHIQADDINALRQALNEALTDTERLRRMGEESFRIVKEEINIDVMVSVFYDAFSSVS